MSEYNNENCAFLGRMVARKGKPSGGNLPNYDVFGNNPNTNQKISGAGWTKKDPKTNEQYVFIKLENKKPPEKDEW